MFDQGQVKVKAQGETLYDLGTLLCISDYHFN